MKRCCQTRNHGPSGRPSTTGLMSSKNLNLCLSMRNRVVGMAFWAFFEERLPSDGQWEARKGGAGEMPVGCGRMGNTPVDWVVEPVRIQPGRNAAVEVVRTFLGRSSKG